MYVYVLDVVFSVLYASCGSSQCCVLHDLQFVIADRGCKRQPYGRGILQSRSHNCLVSGHECLLLSTHPVAVSAFMICRGLCACTEMVWMCVLYVSFGSKVRTRTVAMGSSHWLKIRIIYKILMLTY